MLIVFDIFVYMLMCTFTFTCHVFVSLSVLMFLTQNVFLLAVQGTGGKSIYGSSFEDESFACMSLLLPVQ